MMFTPEAGAKLRVQNAPGATALSSGTAVVVLFGLLGTLLVLRTILLLCRPGLVIAIAVVLLLDAIALLLSSVILLRAIVLLGAVLLLRPIVLLRGLGVILLLSVRFLLGFVGGPLLILFAFIRFFALLGLFLFFGFFLGPIFIGLLPRVAGGADKENHHRCTNDELHFDSSISFFASSQAQT
jgi:hypothetical protein